MAEYKLEKPFDIDHGELDGLRPQECFVLGYELAMIDSLLLHKDGFSRPVHAANRARIERFCRLAGRNFKLGWMQDDASESWMQLEVQAK